MYLFFFDAFSVGMHGWNFLFSFEPYGFINHDGFDLLFGFEPAGFNNHDVFIFLFGFESEGFIEMQLKINYPEGVKGE